MRALILSLVLLSTSLFSQSPYRTSWSNDGPALGAGIVFGVSGLIFDSGIRPLSADDVASLSRESINTFDRSATFRYSQSISNISDLFYGAAMVAPLFLLGDPEVRDDWETFAAMYSETMILSGSLTTFAKGTTQRIRPYAYNPDVPLVEKTNAETRRSFFSGHTTMAFSSAVFFSTVYGDYFPHSGWRPYIWTGTLLAAGATGYLRYESGEHFPTDILVGAIVGSAIGYLIPALHKAENKQVELTPVPYGPHTGIILQLKI
ncbi:MAG: phosphatase PAP2 family protein [Bacteroidota bacterium]